MKQGWPPSLLLQCRKYSGGNRRKKQVKQERKKAEYLCLQVLRLKGPTDSTRKAFYSKNISNRVPGYKIGIQKSVAFPHTNSQLAKKEIEVEEGVGESHSHSFKKKWAGEIASLGNYLLLILDPCHTPKNQDTSHICIPCGGEIETDSLLELTGQPVQLNQ